MILPPQKVPARDTQHLISTTLNLIKKHAENAPAG
jgi:hypothetical protein